MKLTGTEEIILEWAHRSGKVRHGKSGDASPRPIHVKFFNWMDKEHVLKRAPKSLKNNPYGGQQATLIIKVGFIPQVVPARIQYREGDR